MVDQPIIMGVLNITPDSYSDGGLFFEAQSAIDQAVLMVEQGADIIDIGGESTRPGAPEVSADNELKRVLPVIEALSGNIDVPISIDTSKPVVMKRAFDAGASIINDVYALRSEGALEMAASLGADVCLMHMQNQPKTMQIEPSYTDVVAEVLAFLEERTTTCTQAGMASEQIILDPGFGFGKTLAHNLSLFNAIDQFVETGHPVLVGVSRKTMIGQMLGIERADQRLIGSVAMALLAAQRGAAILRVHDVLETKQAIDAWQTTIREEN